jgi:ribonuclease BN (tRNA processing enzyme)
MKLTILGNNGGIPTKNNACSSFLIQTEQTNILFDCGPGTLDKLAEYLRLDELDAIIISHFHPDHYSDLLCVKKTFELCGELFGWKPLTIFCPTPTRSIRQVITTAHIHYEYYDRIETPITFRDFTLDFSQIEHDPTTPCYACSIQETESKARIVLTGDIGDYNDENLEFFKNTDALICDCFVPEEYQDEECKHLSPTRAIRLGEKAETPMLMLTHFNTFIPFSEYRTEMENAKPKVPTYIGKPKEVFYF